MSRLVWSLKFPKNSKFLIFHQCLDCIVTINSVLLVSRFLKRFNIQWNHIQLLSVKCASLWYAGEGWYRSWVAAHSSVIELGAFAFWLAQEFQGIYDSCHQAVWSIPADGERCPFQTGEVCKGKHFWSHRQVKPWQVRQRKRSDSSSSKERKPQVCKYGLQKVKGYRYYLRGVPLVQSTRGNCCWSVVWKRRPPLVQLNLQAHTRAILVQSKEKTTWSLPTGLLVALVPYLWKILHLSKSHWWTW